VQIVDFTTVDAELRALSLGQVDVAAGDYGDLFAKQSNLPKNAFKILADGYDAAPGVVQIMTMPDSPVQDASQLSLIGAPNVDQVDAPRGGPNSLVIASATSVLQSYGVNLSNLSWRSMSQTQEISQLVSGKLEAVLLTQPTSTWPSKRRHRPGRRVQRRDRGYPAVRIFTSTGWRDKTKEVAALPPGLLRQMRRRLCRDPFSPSCRSTPS
jgi:hypothetical protein